VLVEEGDADASPPPHGALLGLAGARQHPQQGRLAGAVAPDHAQPVAGGDGDRQVLEEGAVGTAGGDSLGVDQDHPVQRRSGRPLP